MSSWERVPPKPAADGTPTSGHETVPLSTSPHRLHAITHTIESWFGSLERFESNLVQVVRVGIVDCVTYPFTVFSHQCQLYPYYTVRFSITSPLATLIVMNNIARGQSVSALWRGWKPHVFLLIVQPFLTAFLAKIFSSFNREGLWRWAQAILIKGLPHLVTMPLLSYKYLEVAQTTQDKLSGDVMTEMLDRPLLRQDGFRRVPFLVLATPTLLRGLLSSAVSFLSHRLFQKLLQQRRRVPSSPSSSSALQNVYSSAITALWVDYFSLLLTDVLLYPLETVLVRLYCQGVPALVDNIQSGTAVTHVASYNTGPLDCMSGLWESEGALGFFKGFSSLLIRYSIHGLVLILLWRTALALDSRLAKRAS